MDSDPGPYSRRKNKTVQDAFCSHDKWSQDIPAPSLRCRIDDSGENEFLRTYSPLRQKKNSLISYRYILVSPLIKTTSPLPVHRLVGFLMEIMKLF